ncbi:MAG: enoyl-CoA hydratase/isomerase family protein [Vicinamibacterales bacterium]
MTFENLLVSHEGSVRTITINRPNVLNALNAATIGELRLAVGEAIDAPEVRVVVLTGSGDRAFVAGADINELAEAEPAEALRLSQRGHELLGRIERAGKPVIAAINGFALGGGCELAMACTFRFAADCAKLGQPEINLGIIPGYGGTQRLARLIGRDRALELVLSGRHVPADEAFQLGLVTRVIPAARLLEETYAFAAILASKSAIALRLALDAVNRGLDMTLAEACAYEASLFAVAAATDDKREGTRAFLEKRRPAFTGR